MKSHGNIFYYLKLQKLNESKCHGHYISPMQKCLILKKRYCGNKEKHDKSVLLYEKVNPTSNC